MRGEHSVCVSENLVKGEHIMKRLITGAMLLAFSAALVGCEASAKVGDPDDTSTRTTTYSNGGSYEKKTTTVREPDGDVKTKTEINRNP